MGRTSKKQRIPAQTPLLVRSRTSFVSSSSWLVPFLPLLLRLRYANLRAIASFPFGSRVAAIYPSRKDGLAPHGDRDLPPAGRLLLAFSLLPFSSFLAAHLCRGL